MDQIKLFKNEKKIIKPLVPKQDWILTDSHPLLRQKSHPVTSLSDDEWLIINKMIAYIDCCYENKYHKYHLRPGIAVAAPQMGLSKQIIYVHFDDEYKEHKYLLANPKIISFSSLYSYVDNGEGCLSVPNDVKGNIKRNYKIIVEAFDLINGEPIQITATGLLSICLQHEIDHLNGILYTDHINKADPFFVQKDWIKIG